MDFQKKFRFLKSKIDGSLVLCVRGNLGQYIFSDLRYAFVEDLDTGILFLGDDTKMIGLWDLHLDDFGASSHRS